MATRGGIVRVTGENTFKGRYHHFDAYPDGLGKTLWDLYRERHNKNLEAMMKELIDDHPAGWSSINNADWSQSPGYGGRIGVGEDKGRPQCYCHGERSETPHDLTQANAGGADCEYIYAFVNEDGKDMMLALKMFSIRTTTMFGNWKLMAKIDLNGEEPAWSELDKEEDEDE
jgi:hypothetical protein